MKINQKEVITNGFFVYDGCHKIYITENEKDIKMAKQYDYKVLPIEKLEETYRKSCELRFISNWRLTKQYVKQFENADFNY